MTYIIHRRETVEKESFLATFEDIEKNDFNLNIPRYVDNFEKEEINLNALLTDMKRTDKELGQAQGEFLSLLKDLSSSDETIVSALNNLIIWNMLEMEMIVWNYTMEAT